MTHSKNVFPRKKVFISGPMENIPDKNRANFEAAQEELEKFGWVVLNPWYNNIEKSSPRKDHMRADIKMLLECDAIYSLIGWKDSPGATTEFHVAEQIEIPHMEQTSDWNILPPWELYKIKPLRDSFGMITYNQLQKKLLGGTHS